jgi:glucose/arabinose dehydrogenase
MTSMILSLKQRLAAGTAIALVIGGVAALASAPAHAQTAPAPFIVGDDPSLNVSYNLTAIATGLQYPYAMNWLPDGTMLVTERPGRLRVIRNGQLDPTPVSGLPNVLVAPSLGLVFQAGLFDVSPHPNFAQNRLLYITYSAGTEQANTLNVARGTFDGRALSNVQVIFTSPTTKPEYQHYGGRIAWLPDGTFLLTHGDGGNPPIQQGNALIREQAQNPGSVWGKILRMRDDGTAAPDNPFVNTQGADARVYSIGHRHPQGVTHDPVRNVIWSHEHGALGGDELNLIQPGKNYGWPRATYSKDYVGATTISAHTNLPGMEAPRLVWTRTVAPSGMFVYTGNQFPQWRGSIISGSLAYQDLRRTILDTSGNIVGQESLRIGQRVRDARQGPDGNIYVTTDEGNGRVFRMSPVTN